MANQNKTPILQMPREQGGTLYVFPSAMEDVGLNLNSRANSVAMSHYALLDIPQCDPGHVTVQAEPIGLSQVKKKNLFNITLNADFADNAADEVGGMTGAEALARSLQNYAMNLETVLVNRSAYSYQEYSTVSEKVFWRWLKESGAIRFKPSGDKVGSAQYYSEGDYFAYAQTPDDKYSSVVKCFGSIDSGNSLSTEFGMFNETYLSVPSSYGSGRVYFAARNPKGDNNYPLGSAIAVTTDWLEGREKDNDEIVYTENKPYTDRMTSAGSCKGITSDGILVVQPAGGIDSAYRIGSASPEYLTSIKYDKCSSSASEAYAMLKSNLDGIEIVKDIATIQKLLANSGYDSGALASYDEINADSRYAPESEFEFNAVLLYYSIYDTNNYKTDPLATNLFGVLFLDNPKDDSTGTGYNVKFKIPALSKKMSGAAGFGTGYSFRINIKTQSVYDNTDSVVCDSTASNAELAEDMSGVVSSLNHAVEAVKGSLEATQAIKEQYVQMLSLSGSLSDKADALDKKLSAYIAGDSAVPITRDIINAGRIRSIGTALDFDIYDAPGDRHETMASLSTSGLDVSGLVAADSMRAAHDYVSVTKFYEDVAIAHDQATGKTQSPATDEILDGMFVPDGATGKCALAVRRATVCEQYQYSDPSEGIVTGSTDRGEILYLDPDSSLFEDMPELVSGIEELHNERLNSSYYKTAGVDYASLLPYVVCELQRINARLAKAGL